MNLGSALWCCSLMRAQQGERTMSDVRALGPAQRVPADQAVLPGLLQPPPLLVYKMYCTCTRHSFTLHTAGLLKVVTRQPYSLSAGIPEQDMCLGEIIRHASNSMLLHL